MTKTIYEIDKDGFMTYQTMEFDGEELPDNFIDVPLPSDEKGNQLPFWKPKWTGEEWIEARPKEEIEKEKNRPAPKTPIELVNEDVDVLAEAVSFSLDMHDGTQQDVAFLAETVSDSLETTGNVLDDSAMLAETLAYALDELELVKNELATLKGEN